MDHIILCWFSYVLCNMNNLWCWFFLYMLVVHVKHNNSEGHCNLLFFLKIKMFWRSVCVCARVCIYIFPKYANVRHNMKHPQHYHHHTPHYSQLKYQNAEKPQNEQNSMLCEEAGTQWFIQWLGYMVDDQRFVVQFPAGEITILNNTKTHYGAPEYCMLFLQG
jgi:hypothetical protein